MNTVYLIIALLCSIVTLYVYSYFADETTDIFYKYSFCLWELNWLEMPSNLQKYVIPMIAYSQRPVFYHGLGLVKVNCDTFAKVWIVSIGY